MVGGGGHPGSLLQCAYASRVATTHPVIRVQTAMDDLTLSFHANLTLFQMQYTRKSGSWSLLIFTFNCNSSHGPSQICRLRPSPVKVQSLLHKFCLQFTPCNIFLIMAITKTQLNIKLKNKTRKCTCKKILFQQMNNQDVHHVTMTSQVSVYTSRSKKSALAHFLKSGFLPLHQEYGFVDGEQRYWSAYQGVLENKCWIIYSTSWGIGCLCVSKTGSGCWRFVNGLRREWSCGDADKIVNHLKFKRWSRTKASA